MRRAALLTAWLGALRAGAIAALLLALACPNLPFPSRGRRVVVLVDVSASVGASGVESSRRRALDVLGALERRDRAAIACFAGGQRVITRLAAPKAAALALERAELSAPAEGATDLGAALSLGRELAGKGKGASILLFSDGRSNAGLPLPSSTPGGVRVPIFAYPAGEAGWGLAGLGLRLPGLARPGERISASWILSSGAGRDISYEVLVDGEVAQRGTSRLEPGRNELPLEFASGGAGSRLVEARVTGGSDSTASSRGVLAVGNGAAVLVVYGGELVSPIAAALAAQGMPAIARGVEGLPSSAAGYAPYSCLVLDDLPALAMTEAQQTGIVDFVSGGGGLLVVGGESSLGRGEYFSTPLEDLLPVETDSRQRLIFTRAKILFVIDHSGSMSERVGSGSKQLAAMRGVAAALPGLSPQDEVGILTFDSAPTWTLRFTPASQREAILSALSRLDEGGGTDLGSALDEAIRGFGDVGPEKRHAIIMTDGLAPDADYAGLSRRLKAAGVSITTIGIGTAVDDKLLSDLAALNDGVYYRAELDQIPRIIDAEAARLTRDLIQEGRILVRRKGEASLSEGIGEGLPPIGGYLLVKAKPLSSVHLEAEGRSSQAMADPLLASWRYGAGRVAVFTSDSGGRWLASWAGLPAFNRLWAQIARAIERPELDPGLKASASVEGGTARVVVDAIGPDGRSATGLRLVCRKQGGIPVEMEEVQAGRYEARLPLDSPGLTSFEIADILGESRGSAWTWTPPAAELAETGPDQAALGLAASTSAGRVLGPEDAELPRSAWYWRKFPARAGLACLAVALFLAELFVRSALFGQLAAAREAAAGWWAREVLEANSIRKPDFEERSREGGDDEA